MKRIWPIIFILSIVLAAPLCHAEESPEPPEPISADVYREEGVTVVLPDAWKPFSFVDESGTRTGYLVELWQAWASQTGIAVRYEYKGLPEAFKDMANNATEIHGGLRFAEEHTEFLDYAEAVRSAPSVLVIKDDGPFDCANILSEGTVGIVDEAHTKQLAAGIYPDVKVVAFPDEKAVINALMTDAVEGIAVGYPHLAAMDAETPIMEELNICRTFLYHEVYAAVQKDQIELLALVDNGMAEIPADQMKQITERWFLTGERPKPDWLMAAFPAAIAFIGIVVIVILWLRRRG